MSDKRNNDVERRRIYSRNINAKANAKKRKWIYENISDCCMLCGYNKCDTALELHHIKETELTRKRSKHGNRSSVWKMRWDDLKADAPYMVLLCANCHREVHSGMHPEIPVPEYMKTMERSKGGAPYGYDWVDGKIVKNPETFKIRQRIISLHENGTPYNRIACLLNDEGIPSKHQKKWHAASVLQICKIKKLIHVEEDEHESKVMKITNSDFNINKPTLWDEK